MLKNENLKKIALNLVLKNENTTPFDCLRKNIDIFLEDKDITISKLADEADLSVETLKTLLYGNVKSCKLSTAVALANALGVTVDELAGNMDKDTSKSLRTYETLPERSKMLVDWFINHQKFINEQHPNKKVVSVINPVCSENGNLKLTHDYGTYDISDIGDELYYKIYCGVKIPCNHYMPYYVKDDILLIANDREAKGTEKTVIIVDGNIVITDRRIENGRVKYYGARDGFFRSMESPKVQILGYVVKVV